jgi:hypothetical protein
VLDDERGRAQRRYDVLTRVLTALREARSARG